VTTVSARATSGGINLLETDALVVDDTTATVLVVNADATTTSLTDVAQADVATTAGNGAIVLRTTNGTLTLKDSTGVLSTGPNGTWGPLNYNNTAVSANGSGNVLVQALNAAPT